MITHHTKIPFSLGGVNLELEIKEGKETISMFGGSINLRTCRPTDFRWRQDTWRSMHKPKKSREGQQQAMWVVLLADAVQQYPIQMPSSLNLDFHIFKTKRHLSGFQNNSFLFTLEKGWTVHFLLSYFIEEL